MTEFNILDYKCDELTTIENDEILFMTKDEDGEVLAVYKDIKGCVDTAYFHTNGNCFGEYEQYIILKPKPKKKLYIAISKDKLKAGGFICYPATYAYENKEFLIKNYPELQIVEVEIKE